MLLQITGGSVQIDDEDVEKVNSFKWHVGSTGYAVWRGILDGNKVTIRMHRFVTDCPKGLVIDHINHDRLDNRKANLFIGTQSDNMRNLTNQGKGYWFQKQNNNWVVEINSKHRGTFKTEQEASEFAQLVRQGKADMKPKVIRTHCENGHSLVDAYIVSGEKRCRPCQAQRSRDYYKRKMNKLKEVLR